MNPPFARPALVLACVVLAACGAVEAGEDGLADELEPGSVELAGTVPACPTGTSPAPLCSGAGAAWLASVRVGASGTTRSDVAQTFRLGAPAIPTSLKVFLRPLRKLPAGVDSTITAELHAVAGGLVPTASAGALATATVAHAAIAASGTVFTFTNAPALAANQDYAFVLRAAPPASGSVLVGAATLQTSTFEGEVQRRSVRGADSSAPFVARAGTDLAFVLSLTSVSPLQITPATANVGAGGTVEFGATGGVSPYTFELALGGGAIEGRLYTAPAAPGTASVRVTDFAGATSTATITIGCAAGSLVFSYLGVDQPFTLPLGCTTLTAKVWGAGGGAGVPTAAYGSAYTSGGAGGFSTARITATPGTAFIVMVGAGGARLSGALLTPSYGGGGGVKGSYGGGQGGGRSALRLASCGDVITAGGGGGGSNSQTYAASSGGAGGGANGGTPDGGPQSAGGATQVAGGEAGAYNGATAGLKYEGGLGSSGPHGSSGGGGGWWGGGGANIGAGGGGSGYIGGCGGVTVSNASTLIGSGSVPPMTGDPNYGGGAGVGGELTGGHGRVVLSWAP